MNYREFIASKKRMMQKRGFEPDTMPKHLREDQKFVAGKAIEAGCYGVFGDAGLGKTFIELEWSRQVAKHGPVLIAAPLCVGIQTVEMGKEHGYDVNICREPDDLRDGLNITNWDRLANFESIIPRLAGFCGDEISIIKNVDGKTREFVLKNFRRTRFRLGASATPAPNDYMELGNQAEFLGVCSREEMLTNYFTHDGGDTSKWRLKGHAQKAFWEWVNTWSVTYRKPSDLDPSFSDEGFVLPELKLHQHILNDARAEEGVLFNVGKIDLAAHRDIRKTTINDRVEKCAELTAETKGSWVHWCELNAEGDAIVDAIKGAVQICGADSIDKKEETLWAFTKGQLKTLVTKYRITSQGLNWQHCRNTTLGATHSFEQVYQAIKRFHRFGQKKPVNAHFVMMDSEYTVFQNFQRKFDNHERITA